MTETHPARLGTAHWPTPDSTSSPGVQLFGRAIASELSRADAGYARSPVIPDRAAATADQTSIRWTSMTICGLVAHPRGATTLYNTYWVRFATADRPRRAVENSRTLFHAARRAGVQRIVHVSITQPSVESPYPYFRGKALVERALAESCCPRRCCAQPSCSVATAC